MDPHPRRCKRRGRGHPGGGESYAPDIGSVAHDFRTRQPGFDRFPKKFARGGRTERGGRSRGPEGDQTGDRCGVWSGGISARGALSKQPSGRSENQCFALRRGRRRWADFLHGTRQPAAWFTPRVSVDHSRLISAGCDDCDVAESANRRLVGSFKSLCCGLTAVKIKPPAEEALPPAVRESRFSSSRASQSLSRVCRGSMPAEAMDRYPRNNPGRPPAPHASWACGPTYQRRSLRAGLCRRLFGTGLTCC